MEPQSELDCGLMISNAVTNESTVNMRTSGFWDARGLILLGVVASLAFLPFLGSAGMFDPTDSFFIESGREMLETHKFIVPLMNYEQWLDKPALDFCLIAGSLNLLGLNEFAGRFPAALSGILECLAVYLLSKQILSRRQAFLSSLALLASPLFIVVGRTSLSDEPLSLFLTTALLSFAVASIKKNYRFLIPAYAALGVAILLKGPPLTLIFTGLILVGYLLLSYRAKFFGAGLKLRPIKGLIGAAVIALPYYIWAHIGTSGEFTTNFFLRQNLGRAAGTVNHVRPFWWYAPVLMAGVFPWSAMLLFGGRYFKKILWASERATTGRRELLKFACCWSVLGFLFFSAVPTKLETYIVPILPAIALLIGNFLDVLIRLGKTFHARFAKTTINTGLGLTAVAALAGPLVIHLAFDKQGHYLAFEILGAVLVLALNVVTFLMLKREQLVKAVYALLSAVLSLCAVFIPLLFIVYHQSYQQPIDALIDYSKAHNAELGVMYFPMPSAIFKYQHAIPVIKSEAEMRSYADAAPDKRWVLINKDVLSLLKWTERSPRVVAHEGRWWLFAVGRNCMKEDTIEWNGPNVGFYPSLADKHH